MSDELQRSLPVRTIRLQSRIFLDFEIRIVTGLHIGGSPGTLSIGNVDNPVIRNAFTDEPYVPGSSLRGKMRSQQEKHMGKPQNNRIGQINIHTCKQSAEYLVCNLCRTFGVPGEYEHSETSRLIVRDAFLTEKSRDQLRKIRTDLPFTEVKWEAAIDRVTSAATPRQQERVLPGAVFGGSLTFSLYNETSDIHLFAHVLEALELVQDDYLGGQGARGSGQVAFANLSLVHAESRNHSQPKHTFHAETLAMLREQWQSRGA